MENTKINVLGTEYVIVFEKLTGSDIDGFCDYTSKEIHIRSDNENKVGNFEELQRKQLRHEIIHAFLSESGLQANFEHYLIFSVVLAGIVLQDSLMAFRKA